MYIYRSLLCATLVPFAQTFRSFAVKKRLPAFLSMKKPDLQTFMYSPKSENQRKYVKLLNDDSCKILIATGPAGTGKTLFACQKAIGQLKSGETNKIVITRPVVTIEEDIGFLPGNLNKKMDPWVRPIFDIFLEYYSKTEVDSMFNSNKIEICPLMFMRGRTFKNAFIIADEMQNSSPIQMRMLSTRIGDNSRMVITGDLRQTDIIKNNGLEDILQRLNNINTTLIKQVTFVNEDVERSAVVKTLINMYETIPEETKKENETTDIIALANIDKNVTSALTSDACIEKLSNNSSNNKSSNSKSIIIHPNETGNGDAALIPFSHYYGPN